MSLLADVDSTCRLCMSRLDTGMAHIQSYLSTLCEMAQFSLDHRLPQKMCADCVAQVEAVQTVRERVSKTESFWSQCLKGDDEPQLEVEIDNPPQESGFIIDLDSDENSENGEVLDLTVDEEESEDLDYAPSPHMSQEELKNSDYKGENDKNFEDLDYVPSPEDSDEQEDSEKSKGRPTFSCPICPSGFGRRDNLQLHIRNKHPGHSVCVKCFLNFSTSSELTAHKILCSKRAKCCICKAECDNGKEYENHLRTVHQKKTFMCDYERCDHVSLQKSAMNQHKLTHSTVKRLKCSYAGCDAAFHHKNALNVHVRYKHTGEKPFKCQHCRRRFCDASHRSRHDKICKKPK